MNVLTSTLLALLLIVSGTVPAGAATASTGQGEVYAGTHVEFETSGDAIVDYTVNGETVLQSITVQSRSTAERRGDVRAGIGLSAVTQLSGAAVSLDSRTEVSATVTAESGASMRAHDNSRGILVVRSGGESQYVTVNVSSSTQTDRESDKRVVVTTEDGTTGTFVVVGDGEVTVNDRGNVSASVEGDGALVFRSYPDGRDDDDRREEQLISEGKAAAEVHVMQKSEEGSEFVADVVRYSEDTTVEVTQKTAGTVTMTAERSQSRGKIVITSVSERAIGSVEDLRVTVDGEAAVEASSYSELESAIDNGDASKFLVRQQSSARASTDVLVAVDHFSQREITLSEDSDGSDGSDSTGSDGDGDNRTTDAQGPGFGPIGVLFALVATVALTLARRR
ncbi:hypothetical protein ACFQPA_21160 [Halomarina halobia]|uniref:PGF-CTERM sorting domain-containing protein n=2 Tax=Halomarina halobia TaxID=3033386 RepID=A0ABD6AF90_9EURY